MKSEKKLINENRATYYIGSENKKWLEEQAGKEGRSVSNFLSRLIDKERENNG